MRPTVNRGNQPVEPTKLTFTFTNVSQKPIKLNTHDMTWELLRLDVKGPDAGSVMIARLLLARLPTPLEEKDFITIDPGKSWTEKSEANLPGRFGPFSYSLLKPGQYRVTAAYTHTQEQAGTGEPGRGSWTGSVTSNEVVLRVVPPDMQLPEAVKHPVFLGPVAAEPEKPEGKADETLKLTLAAEKTELKMTADGKVGPTKLTFTFTNVSTKPVKLNAYLLTIARMKLDVKGPDAESVRENVVVFKMMAWAPKAEDFPTIEPGKSWTEKSQPSFPGLFGRVSYTLLKPGEYRVKAVYTCTEAPQEQSDLTAGCWTGSLTSNEVVFKVVK
jgi:hypothetical protein